MTRTAPPVISAEQSAAIRSLPGMAEVDKTGLDIAGALDFYHRRYVAPLRHYTRLTSDTVIADTGAGMGWLAAALALTTPARVIAIEPQQKRVDLGRRMAEVLGCADRVTWMQGGLGAEFGPAPLDDQSVDVAFAVEVLEHVGGDRTVLTDLARISRDLLVVTTPNKWFPVIAHDTRLPFCHWLPLPLRDVYASLAGRRHQQKGNRFWSPRQIAQGFDDFERVSGFLNYPSLDDFMDTYPYYLPYDQGRQVQSPGRFQNIWYALVARDGTAPAALLPNLAGVFRRKTGT